MKSRIADLRNVPSDGGMGGAITAALYLRNFVRPGSPSCPASPGGTGGEGGGGKDYEREDEEVPCIHFDVNGADGKGWGEAQGLRAALEMIKGMQA